MFCTKLCYRNFCVRLFFFISLRLYIPFFFYSFQTDAFGLDWRLNHHCMWLLHHTQRKQQQNWHNSMMHAIKINHTLISTGKLKFGCLIHISKGFCCWWHHEWVKYSLIFLQHFILQTSIHIYTRAIVSHEGNTLSGVWHLCHQRLLNIHSIRWAISLYEYFFICRRSHCYF